MPITGIKASPSIGLPGRKIQLFPEGTYESSLDLRWYVREAPPSSALNTLANYEDRNLERLDIRLKTNAAGAEVVVDVPGKYTFALYPTTLYRFKKGWSDALPDSGELAEADNEIGALPGYAGGTAAVTPVTLTFWVAVERKRTVGVAPETGTLSVVTYNNAVVTEAESKVLGTDRAKITGMTTESAKLALYHEDVQTVLDLIKASTSVNTDLLVLPSDIITSILRFNAHLALTSVAGVHNSADVTNGMVLGEPTTLAEAIAVLNQLKTKYNAHRLDAVAHNSADNTFVITANNATNLANGITLWSDCWTILNDHMVNTTAHDGVGDRAANEHVEVPSTEQGLIDKTVKLRALYEEHIAKTTSADVHANADTENEVAIAFDTEQGFIQTVNSWADALEKHATNRAADGTEATSAYHESGGNPVAHNIKIPLRAGDKASAQRVAELCFVAYEQHGLNTSVHGSKAWGSTSAGAALFDNWLNVRLVKAWQNAVRPFVSQTIDNTNPGELDLVLLAGWT